MAYDFNDVAKELANGADIEDICKSFTEIVNAAVRKRNENKKAFDEACQLLSEVWLKAVCIYYDIGEWPVKSPYTPEDLAISAEAFKELISNTAKNYELMELVETTLNEIRGEQVSVRSKKSAANSPKKLDADHKQDFDTVMHDFFKSIGIEE